MLETSSPYTIIPFDKSWKVYSKPSSAILFGHGWKHNLITNERSTFDSPTLLEELNLENANSKRIIHLSYEAGYLNNKNSELLKDSQWLAVDLHYENVQEIEVPAPMPVSLDLIEAPTKEEYDKAFDEGYEHLEKGDCYQFNLTFPFIYKTENDFNSLCSKLFSEAKNRGEYAHATYLPCLSWGILSNSPECLFNKKENFLETKPIKGTIGDEPGAWEKMLESEKDKAELYMITDLLRNDLNRIEPKAKVKELRAPLKVPGLLHQYSHITLETSKNIELKKVISSLYPGGSITGAPKIRVMKILDKIESGSRGAYCGSTLFFNDDVRASINIRTAEVDTRLGELRYGAGGGITLLSKKEEEFLEMMGKLHSFILVLQSPDVKKVYNINPL